MPRRSRRTALVGALVALALVAGACGGSTDDAPLAMPPDTEGLDALAGTLQGRGSSFQDTFQQQVAADFGAVVAHLGGDVTITYTKSGSAEGKKSLADASVDFAGSDSPIKDDERAGFGDRELLYFPIMGGPITLAYQLDGIEQLNLAPDTIAGIFQGDITAWNDPAIRADNPDEDLPSTSITVVHRSDGSGTTNNFTKFLDKAAPDTWRLGAGDTVAWPSATQGAEKNTGVTNVIASTEGAIGYADLPDAAVRDLAVAWVGNRSGEFVRPTPDNASAALAAAEVADDLTYDPLAVDQPGAYPITAPTWIIVDAEQANAGTAEIVRSYLRYLLTTGQARAKGLLYAPLPDDLAARALAQVDRIRVGSAGRR